MTDLTAGVPSDADGRVPWAGGGLVSCPGPPGPGKLVPRPLLLTVQVATPGISINGTSYI
jgi:hypothetical protein